MRRISCFLLFLCLLWGTIVPAYAARIIYSFSGGATRPRVALTFDDGPHPRYTPQILDILKEYGVNATFFAVGSNAENYPQLVQRICEEGHELGNHTHNHFHVAKLSREALCADIVDNSLVIGGTVGHLHHGHTRLTVADQLGSGFFKHGQRQHGRTCGKIVNSVHNEPPFSPSREHKLRARI